jgi:[protein-PII] uridylyltransferase
MEWLVAPHPHGEIVSRDELHQRIAESLNDNFDIHKLIVKRIEDYASLPAIAVPKPTVETFEDAATDATVIEVRSHDRPALLYSVGNAISQCNVDIRAAIVTTLGAEAIDTLYVTEIGGGALSPERASEVSSRLTQSLK